MEYDEKILFIRTSDHIVQIDFKKYNTVVEFLDKLSEELCDTCYPLERIERIMVCKSELRN